MTVAFGKTSRALWLLAGIAEMLRRSLGYAKAGGHEFRGVGRPQRPRFSGPSQDVGLRSLSRRFD